MVGNEAPHRCRRFLVSGRVQGVYYRASACDAARRLGLIGWVRNVADGRVEAVACGAPGRLDEFEQWLWQGPRSARVEQVIATDIEPQQFTGFEIR